MLTTSGFVDISLRRNDQAYIDLSDAENAILYFYSHYCENVSIDELAKLNNVTPCWFRKCFKKRTGMSPHEFLNDIRLSQAQQMITTSDFKIGEIAERCGYDNSFYFSRIFSKYIGCSPSEYRKKFWQNTNN